MVCQGIQVEVTDVREPVEGGGETYGRCGGGVQDEKDLAGNEK